jgi:hypothetical protein
MRGSKTKFSTCFSICGSSRWINDSTSRPPRSAQAANKPKQVHWLDDPSACNASERVRRARLGTAIEAGGRGIGRTITAETGCGCQRCSGTPPGGLASRATFRNLQCISRAAPAWLNIGKIGEGYAPANAHWHPVRLAEANGFRVERPAVAAGPHRLG